MRNSSGEFPTNFSRNCLLLLLLLALSACGGRGLPAAEPQAAKDAPSFAELSRLLDQEFARLGIDPQRTAASVFSGGTDPHVFDLDAQTVGIGTAANTFQVELSWTERLVGDYDGNGRVTVNDLTPIGLNFGSAVTYDSKLEHLGFAFWPSGDPEDGDSGQANWQLAMVDGNGDGTISIQDLTPIALHWQQRIEGYRIYRLGPGDTVAQMLPNPLDPESPVTLPRDESAQASTPRRYHFLIDEPCDGDFQYSYFVLPFADGEEGDPSSPGRSVSFNGCEAAPIALLSADVQSGDAPLLVNFDASASSDLDGSIVKYELDFGEGLGFEQIAEPTASHEYAVPDDYSVWLRVTDDSDQISVSQPLSISVSEAGTNQDPVAMLTAEPLTAASAPLLVSFDASASSDPEGDTLSFGWDFGDQTIDGSGGVANPVHTYTANGAFDAVVTVSDGNGGSSTASVTIRIGNPPTARVNAGPLEGNAPLLVHFDGSGSSDIAPGSISHFFWDWDNDGINDEDSGTNAITEHEYSEPGFFQARLTVQDTDGLTHSTSLAQNGEPLLVHVNAPPSVELSSDSSGGDWPLLINFSAAASDSDGVIAEYVWDTDADGIFNESDNGENLGQGLPNLALNFESEGMRTVSVKVIDNLGAENTDSVEVNITSNQTPVAVLSAQPLTGVSPLEVSFDASASFDDHAVVGYEWDWDTDGNYDTVPDPSPLAQHTFSGGGEHVVTVRVSDASGLTDTESVSFVLDRWIHTWGSSQAESIRDMARDSSGNLYMAGTVKVTETDTDTLLVKFNEAGSLVWARHWGGGGNDLANAMCLDVDGNVVVCGDSNSFGTNRGFLISVDPDGDMNWQYAWATPNTSHLNGAVLSSTGDLVLLGDRNDASGRDAAILVMHADGTLNWQKYWAKNQATEQFYSAAISPAGDIYAVGSRFDDLSGNSLNALVVRLDMAGNYVWDRQFDRLDEDDSATAAAFDPVSETLYVAGYSEKTNSSDSSDALLLVMDKDGNVGDRFAWGGSFSDTAEAVMLGPAGSICVGCNSASFGVQQISVILRFSAGLDSLIDQNSYSAGTDLSIGGLQLDPAGPLCLAGTTRSAPGAIGPLTGDWLLPLTGDVQNNVGSVGDVTAMLDAQEEAINDVSGELDTAQSEGAAFILRWSL